MEARNFSSRDSSNLGSNTLFSPSRFTVPSIEQMIKKQIQDLRERILDYKVLGFELNKSNSKKKSNSEGSSSSSKIPDHADIIIFGPTGAGKSSLIRTFYRALYDTKTTPKHIQDSLCIKNVNENEGTTKFTAILIKKRSKLKSNATQNKAALQTTQQQIQSARETTTLETFYLPKQPQWQPQKPGLMTNRETTNSQNLSNRLSLNTPVPQQEQSRSSSSYSILNQDLDGDQVNQIINELQENKSLKNQSKQSTPQKQPTQDINSLEKGQNQKQESKSKNKKTSHQPQQYSSAIIVHDTRGQIWMDENEKQQLQLLIKGKIKDKNQVQQRNYRYAFMLWEFWKRDYELFPSNMIQKSKSLKRKPHCIIFVFDGSFDDIPNGEEETNFYREVLQQCRHRKYMYPQIVLTCADKIEEQLINGNNNNYDQVEQQKMLEMDVQHQQQQSQNIDIIYDEDGEDEEEKKQDSYQDTVKPIKKQLFNKNNSPHYHKKMNLMEQEQRLRDILDLKIEKVALNLGVPRSSVHFIENYKSEEEDQQTRIDYKALRLLHECLLQSDSYIMSNIKEKSKCTLF